MSGHRPFGVVIGTGDDRGTARLSGELDRAAVDGLWTALDKLHEQGFRRVELDLSDLDFLDAAALGALVRADRRFRDADAVLVLTGLRQPQRRLLEITGLDRVLTVE
jgi:anti-anti-sigma factor